MALNGLFQPCTALLIIGFAEPHNRVCGLLLAGDLPQPAYAFRGFVRDSKNISELKDKLVVGVYSSMTTFAGTPVQPSTVGLRGALKNRVVLAQPGDEPDEDGIRTYVFIRTEGELMQRLTTPQGIISTALRVLEAARHEALAISN